MPNCFKASQPKRGGRTTVGVTRRQQRNESSVMDAEQRIAVCITCVHHIEYMLHNSPQDWPQYLNLARSVMAHVDTTDFIGQNRRTSEQIRMISSLQCLAFSDQETSNATDIAAWCMRQWLVISQKDPRNVAALTGLGQAWLGRAQPYLARIRNTTESTPSAASSPRFIPLPGTPSSVASGTTRTEAEFKAGMADYFEARVYLQPATEYLERAVAAAREEHFESGELLVITAETLMQQGHTTSPRSNEVYFKRAVEYLKRAKSTPGFVLKPLLEQYLDENSNPAK